MPGSEVWKLFIWRRASLIWKWCFMGNTLTDEEPMSALFHLLVLYKAQLYTSTHPHLPECELASPYKDSFQQSWAQPGPTFCLPSLDQYLSHPRNPSCRTPVCTWQCPFILRTSSMPFLGLQYRQGDRTSASPASLGVTLFLMGI